jgi:hypothetical protein
MKKILIFIMLFVLCSCSTPERTVDTIVNITGSSTVTITSDGYDEKIEVDGYYSNTFSPRVGSKFSIKWQSKDDKVSVQILENGKVVREGEGKNGEIVCDASTECFIDSLRKKL